MTSNWRGISALALSPPHPTSSPPPGMTKAKINATSASYG
jgi:hypothetical protein